MGTSVIDRESGLTLEEIATRLNKVHSEFVATAGAAITHGIRAGQYLSDAKAVLNHGEWQPWLELNFNGGQSTARLYMAVERASVLLAMAGRYDPAVLTSMESMISAARKLGKPEPEIMTCENCGHDKFNEEGDCLKCRHPHHMPDDAGEGDADAEFDVEKEVDKAMKKVRKVFKDWPADYAVLAGNTVHTLANEDQEDWVKEE